MEKMIGKSKGNSMHITVKNKDIWRLACRCESVSLAVVTFAAATGREAKARKARITQLVVTQISLECNQNEILKYDFKYSDICMEMKLLHWNAVGCNEVGLGIRKIIVHERKSNIKDVGVIVRSVKC